MLPLDASMTETESSCLSRGATRFGRRSAGRLNGGHVGGATTSTVSIESSSSLATASSNASSSLNLSDLTTSSVANGEYPLEHLKEFEEQVQDGDDHGDTCIAKGGVSTPFPWKLHIMLDAIEESGETDVVSWLCHGRAFLVHKPKDFVMNIMPKFFNQSKYVSLL